MELNYGFQVNTHPVPAIDIEEVSRRLKYEGDLLSISCEYGINKGKGLEHLMKLKGLLEKTVPNEKFVLRSHVSGNVWVLGQTVFVEVRGLYLTVDYPGQLVMSVFITAAPEHLTNIFEIFEASFEQVQRKRTIDWWYRKGNSFDSVSVVVQPTTYPLKNEFYPFIPNGFANHIVDYLNSPACILVLTGPPGTGKTSLLRDMIVTHQLKGMLTYDKELLEHDELFVRFMTKGDIDETRLLIIEDADSMLTSREHYGNRCMDRFLNISDGLVSGIKNKKVILTTNTADMRKIDPALVRPGRCFDVIYFRPLEIEEAESAATAANINWRPAHATREYTLAEIFNAGKDAHKKSKIEPVGFVHSYARREDSRTTPAQVAAYGTTDESH